MQTVKLKSMDIYKVVFFFQYKKESLSRGYEKIALTIFLHNRLQDHEAVLDLFLS